MLIVINAYNQEGWTGFDHLLDGSGLAELIGQSFVNLNALKRAARKAADPRTYPTVEYTFQGKTFRWRGDADAGIPGRVVMEVEELRP